MVYDYNHKISIIKSLILGYLTRKYSRHIPIHENCYLCDTKASMELFIEKNAEINMIL